MTMTKFFTKLVTGSALLGTLLLGTAHADTNVQVRETAITSGMWSNGLLLPIQSSTANYWTGFQTISVNTGSSTSSFQAFCIDPFQWSSGAATPYVQTSLNPTFSSTVIANITKLFNYGYANALSGADVNLNAAAMQLALWEVANDDGNLATGKVQKIGSTNASLVSRTESLLSGYTNAAAPALYNFSFYKSGDKQDFIVATPVPEPGTYGMMLIGAGLIGTIIRRRKNKNA